MGGGTHNKNNKNNEITMETQNLNTHGKKRKLSILQQQKTLETIHQQKGGGEWFASGTNTNKKTHTGTHKHRAVFTYQSSFFYMPWLCFHYYWSICYV